MRDRVLRLDVWCFIEGSFVSSFWMNVWGRLENLGELRIVFFLFGGCLRVKEEGIFSGKGRLICFTVKFKSISLAL